MLVCFWLWSVNGLANTPQELRGARLFGDYCAGCHALRYFDKHPVSMPAEDARRWFGQVPPDLSLIATTRGRDWLMAYLGGFYPDAHQPFGTNNALLPGLMMPNPFASWAKDEIAQAAMMDLVVYLEAVAAPEKNTRVRMGVGVMMFFILAGLVLYRLKRLYWRQIDK
jgi:ubiquinol-cytochrome c reductase cytochrome c1 subunit